MLHKFIFTPFCWGILLSGLLWSCGTRKSVPITTGVVAEENMVVSAAPDASKVGLQILEKGGNAVDAAIAVQFALAVTYPQAGNIGGGGFAVVRMNDNEVRSLDFREKASRHAHKDLYLDPSGNVIPRLSLEGHLASGVPGTVMGMVRLHEWKGSLPWEDLIQPAIDLATEGFILTERQARIFTRLGGTFLSVNRHTIPFHKEGGWKE